VSCPYAFHTAESLWAATWQEYDVNRLVAFVREESPNWQGIFMVLGSLAIEGHPDADTLFDYAVEVAKASTTPAQWLEIWRSMGMRV
tara:strand:+ start:1281 stop:1541 length:261 start_codon:yes stop_codon:yes gene_type:complete